MPLRALLFDLDGTLVDTTDAHTESWVEAFETSGYDVEREAVARAIGMGGDKLVPALVGEEADRRDGDALRDRSSEAFERIAKRSRFDYFPGVDHLLRAAKGRGLRLAIATSASEDDLDLIFERAGEDLRPRMDAVTNASDVDDSKPDPEVLQIVLGKLGVAPGEAAFVGDTKHDAEAAARAGVPFIGVATGVWAEDELREAGAVAVYRDAAGLLDGLDDALAAAAREATR